MKWIGNAFIYFGLFIIYDVGFRNRSYFTFSGFMEALLLAVPLLAIGAWIFSYTEGEKQVTVDTNAQSLVTSNAQTPTSAPMEVPGYFFLYLRPFESTNKYRVTDAHLNLFSWDVWERDGYDDIERLLSRSLSPTAQFVALGKPGEHRGAGRVLTSEEEWKEYVARLAKSAALIVMLPSCHEGTLWEMKLITEQGYISKTIFIMPPSDSFFYSASADDDAEVWEKTTLACKEFGLTLPQYTPSGQVFKLQDGAGHAFCRPLPKPDPVSWKQTMQELIDA